MLQLTQKGKEIYGDCRIIVNHQYLAKTGDVTTTYHLRIEKFPVIASNPLELKALIDLGLVEIK